MSRLISIDKFLTAPEIKRAAAIWRTDRTNFHKRVRDEVIKPIMPRINRVLGQENDPDYLAYAVEYLLGKVTT